MERSSVLAFSFKILNITLMEKRKKNIAMNILLIFFPSQMNLMILCSKSMLRNVALQLSIESIIAKNFNNHY